MENYHSYNYRTRILEIDTKDKAEIPIVIYPPFKLRSSLYDKDPVIWVHLLESYIRLIQYLLAIDDSRPLEAHFSDLTVEQLKQWIQRYLSETSKEQSQVLTLGAVNPQISEHNATLRSLVFRLIQRHGLVYFNVAGETLWDFVRVYVKGNSNIVRTLILGNKSGNEKGSGNKNSTRHSTSLVHSLTNYLEDLLANDKFHKDEVQYFAILLGTVSKLNNNSQNNKKPGTDKKESFFETKLSQFINAFVTPKWIQILERYYAGGEGIHSKASKTIFVITVLSCNSDKLHGLIHDQLMAKFTIKNKQSFIMRYPLFFAILKSELIQSQLPDLPEKLAFLLKPSSTTVDGQKSKAAKKISPEDQDKINQITEMFPHLSLYQSEYLLNQHEGDANKVTNALLEDPAIVDELPLEGASSKKSSASPTPKLRSKYDNDNFAKLQFNSKNVILGKKQKLTAQSLDNDSDEDNDAYGLRKKTLSRALKLLYESDEDEPDDTYLDSEVIKNEQASVAATSSGAPNMHTNKNNNRATKLSSDFNDPNDGDDDSAQANRNKEEQLELMLYQTFKKDPACADRSAAVRRSSQRKKLLKETGWSHEQIEGWFRMLEKSPQKVKLLEDKLLFGAGIAQPGKKSGRLNEGVVIPRTSYRKKKYESNEGDGNDGEEQAQNQDRGSNRNQKRNQDQNKNTGKDNKNNVKGGADNQKSKPNKQNTQKDGQKEGNQSSNGAQRQQRNKEKNKSKVANHNRKAGHDKKMSRGF